MKNILIKAYMAFAAAIIAVGCFAVPAGAAEEVVVAVLDYPNYIYMDSNGAVTGYAAEYLEKIAEITGWNYEYRRMTLEEAMSGIQGGDVGIVVGCQYTDERSKAMDYSNMNMGMGGTVLCCETEDNKYAYNDFESYSDMRIGALRGTARIKEIEDFLAEYHISPIITEYKTDDEVKQALADKEIDAMLMSTIRCEEGYKIIANISSVPVYFCTNKSNPEIKKGIDKAIDKIHIENPYYESQLYEKYYGAIVTSLAYTAEEQEYIKNSIPLKVAICTEIPPFSYIDSENTPCGIVISLFELLGKNSGLKFEFVRYDDYQKCINSVNNGEADIIGMLYEDNTWGDRFGTKVSDSYISVPAVIINNKNVPLKEYVGVIKGRYITAMIENDYDTSMLKYYNTAEECIEACNRGDISCLVLGTYEADYYLAMPKYTFLSFSTTTGFSIGFSCGISQNMSSMLMSVINKSIDSLTENEITQIVEQNTATVGKYTLADLIYTDPQIVIIFIVAVSAGVVIIILLISRNIVNTKKNAALKKSNEARLNFLSRMSHEIRTPLSAIIGMNDKAAENIGNEKIVHDCIDKIDISSKHLLHLVNDILDMSKINDGKLVLRQSSFNLSRMLHTVEVVYNELAKTSNINFKIEIGENINPYVFGDELRLKQVLMNLISNALKYNKIGGAVKVMVIKKKDTSNGQVIFFSVKDSGLGIENDKLQKMLVDFERDNTGDVDSNGLGLAIANQLIHKMGGTLTAVSEPDKGSEFSFEIELKNGSTDIDETHDSNDPERLRGKRILLVEDNTINRMVAKDLLEKIGMNVVLAENGEMAVERFALSALNSYDAVLMDIRMPVMDGYEATRKIRAMEREDAHTVAIIALSANAFDEDIAASLSVGMNAHLSKPVDYTKLVKALNKFVR